MRQDPVSLLLILPSPLSLLCKKWLFGRLETWCTVLPCVVSLKKIHFLFSFLTPLWNTVDFITQINLLSKSDFSEEDFQSEIFSIIFSQMWDRLFVIFLGRWGDIIRSSEKDLDNEGAIIFHPLESRTNNDQ